MSRRWGTHLVRLVSGLDVLTSTTGCSTSYTDDNTPGHDSRNGDKLNSASNVNVYRDCAPSKHYISLLGVLLAGFYLCSYRCYIGQHSDSMPQTQFAPRRIIALAVSFCQHGYIDKLFLDSKVVHSTSCAVRRLVHMTGLLHRRRRFHNCVRLGAVPRTSPTLVTRTKHCTSHLDIGVRLPASTDLRALTPRGRLNSVGRTVRAVCANRRAILGRPHTPGFTPTKRDARVVINTSSASSDAVLRNTRTLCNGFGLQQICCSTFDPVPGDPGDIPLTTPPLVHRRHLCRTSFLLHDCNFATNRLFGKPKRLTLSVSPGLT